MVLSIIIINYKTPKLTSEVISSIKKHISSIDYEIIVVDNNSNDNSVEILRNNYNDIKIIENTKNYGYGKAVNLGSLDSNGEYLLILNSDIFIKDDYIENLISFYKEKKAGLLGVELLLPSGKTQRTYSYFPSPMSIFSLQTSLLQQIKCKHFTRYGGIDFKNPNTRKVDWVTGAFMFISKENFDKINGFDENIFMYFEDVDICRKLSEVNLSVYYIPKYSAIHNHSSSVNSTLKGKYNFYKVKELQSALYYLKKYYPIYQKIVSVFLLLILFYGYIIMGIKYNLSRFSKKADKNKRKLKTIREKMKVCLIQIK